MKFKLAIAALIFASAGSQAGAMSPFYEASVQHAKLQIMDRLAYLMEGDEVKAMEGADHASRMLDKVVRSGIRANKSCLFIKSEFVTEQNELAENDVVKRKKVSIEEAKSFNSLLGDYIAAKCLSVK